MGSQLSLLDEKLGLRPSAVWQLAVEQESWTHLLFAWLAEGEEGGKL